MIWLTVKSKNKRRQQKQKEKITEPSAPANCRSVETPFNLKVAVDEMLADVLSHEWEFFQMFIKVRDRLKKLLAVLRKVSLTI